MIERLKIGVLEENKLKKSLKYRKNRILKRGFSQTIQQKDKRQEKLSKHWLQIEKDYDKP